MNLILCEYLHLVKQIFALSSFLTFWTKIEVHLLGCHLYDIYVTFNSCKIVIFQSLCHVPLFVNPWIAAYQASLSYTISLSLFKMSIW